MRVDHRGGEQDETANPPEVRALGSPAVVANAERVQDLLEQSGLRRLVGLADPAGEVDARGEPRPDGRSRCHGGGVYVSPAGRGNKPAHHLMMRVATARLGGYEAQQAVEVTPRTVDPVQQTVATTIQEYLNHPDVERRRALQALRFLARPMASVAVKALREAYRAFQKSGEVEGLLASIEGLAGEFERAPARAAFAPHVLRRDELRLVCFDHLCS